MGIYNSTNIDAESGVSFENNEFFQAARIWTTVAGKCNKAYYLHELSIKVE